MWLSTTGDVLERRPAGGLRGVHRRRRRVRGRPLRLRHRVRLVLLRRPRRRLLLRPPGQPDRDRRGRGPGAPLDRGACRPSGPASTSGTASGPTRAATCTSSPRWTRRTYDPGGNAMGTDHPIAWCQDVDGRPQLVHRPRPHRRVLRRAAVPRPPARRHRDRRGRGRLRLQRHRRRQLREGRARREHVEPDGDRRRRRRPRLLHRAQRPGPAHRDHRRRAHRPQPDRDHGPGVRAGRHRARPRLHDERLGVPLLVARRLGRRQGVALHHGRHEHRPGQRGGRPRGARPAGRVLPRRRRARVRLPGQPLHRHGRQHEPVRVAGLHAHGRARGPRGLRRAAHLGQHQQPVRQGAAHHPAGRRFLHDPDGQPVRPRHRADPARDLRHGLPQPVPHRHRPADRQAHGRRLRPRRGRHQRHPRA